MRRGAWLQFPADCDVVTLAVYHSLGGYIRLQVRHHKVGHKFVSFTQHSDTSLLRTTKTCVSRRVSLLGTAGTPLLKR